MSIKLFRKSLFFALMVVVMGVSLRAVTEFGIAAPNDISWPDIEVEEVVSGLSSPVHLTHAGDGSDRLFVVERPGRIQIIQNDALLGTPFLDIQDRVQSTGGEEGLLSVAFPSEFASKGFFYVYYTNQNGDNQVSRFYISGDPNIADPASEELIIYLDHPNHSNHNGGQIAFGSDGYLYISTGDGGGGGDPDENGQDPASLLGKILRIDVEWAWPLPAGPYFVYLPLIVSGDGTPAWLAYRIPEDNPFVDVPGYREEIWALGLRNPWRFSFDRDTGDLYIGDVGQGSWEEIDYQPAASAGGENYGWNEMEGSQCYLPNCDTTGMTLPVYEYPTHVNGSCAVTGGRVYRGIDYVGLQGIYFFADYCNGIITGLQLEGPTWNDQNLLDSHLSISSFGEDEAGELYFTDISNGEIYQIIEQSP